MWIKLAIFPERLKVRLMETHNIVFSMGKFNTIKIKALHKIIFKLTQSQLKYQKHMQGDAKVIWKQTRIVENTRKGRLLRNN